MTTKSTAIKKLFAAELRRCCSKRYQTVPSNEALANDFYQSACRDLKVSRETIRKWLKGDTFPDLDCLLHLIDWLELDMSKVFLTPAKGAEDQLIEANVQHVKHDTLTDLHTLEIDAVIKYLSLQRVHEARTCARNIGQG